MDGTSDCTMSFRRWQKLTAVSTRKSVPSSMSSGVPISTGAMVCVLMRWGLKNSHYYFSVSRVAFRINSDARSILEIVWKRKFCVAQALNVNFHRGEAQLTGVNG